MVTKVRKVIEMRRISRLAVEHLRDAGPKPG